jgi:hypothetical protein
VELRGFGAFSTREREARSGRNPRTGDAVDVPAKRVPYFKAGKEIRERLNDYVCVPASAGTSSLRFSVPHRLRDAKSSLTRPDGRIAAGGRPNPLAPLRSLRDRSPPKRRSLLGALIQFR